MTRISFPFTLICYLCGTVVRQLRQTKTLTALLLTGPMPQLHLFYFPQQCSQTSMFPFSHSERMSATHPLLGMGESAAFAEITQLYYALQGPAQFLCKPHGQIFHVWWKPDFTSATSADQYADIRYYRGKIMWWEELSHQTHLEQIEELLFPALLSHSHPPIWNIRTVTRSVRHRQERLIPFISKKDHVIVI